MASNIENLQVQIKEEVNYADIGDVQEYYLVPEAAIIVTSSGVERQEIVVASEEMLKMEVCDDDVYYGNVYDQDISYPNPNDTYRLHLNSNEISPVKQNPESSFMGSDNQLDNNYLYQQLSSGSLQAKQMELMRVKKLGGRPKSIKHNNENDEWLPSNQGNRISSVGNFHDDVTLVDENDIEIMKKFNQYPNMRLSKPRKRDFAHRLQWKDKDMKEAMKSVEERNMTIRGAAKKFNVPYSTLKDRVRGRVRHGTKPGVKTVLSPEEEEELVKFIQQMEESGFNLLCIDIREKASELLNLNQRYNSLYKDFIPGHNWLAGFLKRHPGLEVRKATNKSAPPTWSKMRVLLKRFFDTTSQIYKRLNLHLNHHRPLSLSADPSSIRYEEGIDSHIYTMTIVQPPCLSKANIILAASAQGFLLPPYVIGPFSRSSLSIMQQTFPEAFFVTSSDFSSRDKILLSWFRDFFVTKLKNQGTLPLNKVLFLNQPIRYISIRLAEQALKLGVELISMPPSLSKVLQPLNTSFSSSLHSTIQNQLNLVKLSSSPSSASHLLGNQSTSPSKDILTPDQLAQTLKQVFDKSASFSQEIKKNFTNCGLFPLNNQIISIEKLNMANGNGTGSGNLEEEEEEEDEDVGGRGGNSKVVVSNGGGFGEEEEEEEEQAELNLISQMLNSGSNSNQQIKEDLDSKQQIHSNYLRQPDHGLHLLSELSSSFSHHLSYSSSSSSRHPSINRLARNVSGKRRLERFSLIDKRPPKRITASFSEDFMKRVLKSDEEEEEDGRPEEDDNCFKFKTSKQNRKEDGIVEEEEEEEGEEEEEEERRRRREIEDEEEEEEEDGDDDDGLCSRTRPAHPKYFNRKSSILSDLNYETNKNTFRSNSPSYTHNRHFSVRCRPNRSYQQQQQQLQQPKILKRERYLISKSDNDVISKAVESILPPTPNNTINSNNSNINDNNNINNIDNFNNCNNTNHLNESELINKKQIGIHGNSKSLDNNRPLTNVRIALGNNFLHSNNKTTLNIINNKSLKTTKLSYSFKNQSNSLISPPSPHTTSSSNPINNPSLLQNTPLQPPPTFPNNQILLSDNHYGNENLLDLANSVIEEVIIEEGNQININNNQNNNHFDFVNNIVSSTDNNLKYFKKKDEKNDIITDKKKQEKDEKLNLYNKQSSLDQSDKHQTQSADEEGSNGKKDGMIQIGEQLYDWSKKVKMTKCINISGQQVQLIRTVTLKEALSPSNTNDPQLLDFSLELI